MNDAQTWRDKISEDIGSLHAGVASTNENIDRLRRELLGNGQPGLIQQHLGLIQQLFGRVHKLEMWIDRWKGALALAMFLAAAPWIVELLKKIFH